MNYLGNIAHATDEQIHSYCTATKKRWSTEEVLCKNRRNIAREDIKTLCGSFRAVKNSQ